MDRKRKQNLLVAVLFLLAFLLLVSVLFIQIRASKLKTEIEIRKEMEAVEGKRVSETCSESNFTIAETYYTLAHEEEKQTSVPNNTTAKKGTNKKQDEKSLQSSLENSKTTKPQSQEHTTAKSTRPPMKTTTTQAICTETVPTEAPTEQELPPVLCVNFKTKKIHGPNCPILKRTNPEFVREILREQVDDYLWEGYQFCSKCKGYAK